MSCFLKSVWIFLYKKVSILFAYLFLFQLSKVIWGRNNKTSSQPKKLQKEKLEVESSPNQESKTQECFFTLAKKKAGTTYSYLTGKNMIIYSCGNQYIVICYEHENNSIQAISTKTRNAE